jgi:hypothetical protein
MRGECNRQHSFTSCPHYQSPTYGKLGNFLDELSDNELNILAKYDIDAMMTHGLNLSEPTTSLGAIPLAAIPPVFFLSYTSS